ncbi:hypothetical protein HK099_004387, partial [Clydaea vesicula]
ELQLPENIKCKNENRDYAAMGNGYSSIKNHLEKKKVKSATDIKDLQYESLCSTSKRCNAPDAAESAKSASAS